MYIKTTKKTLQKSQKEVYDYLSDLDNFEQLMPSNIERFEVLDKDRFLFALKGMPVITLKRKEQTPYSTIVLGADGGKIPFTLAAEISEVDSNQSDVTLNFNGQFNAMVAMMAKKPITSFMETLSDNLATI